MLRKPSGDRSKNLRTDRSNSDALDERSQAEQIERKHENNGATQGGQNVIDQLM